MTEKSNFAPNGKRWNVVAENIPPSWRNERHSWSDFWTTFEFHAGRSSKGNTYAGVNCL